MRLLGATLTFLFAAIVEATLLDRIEVLSVKPDLFLIAVIYISLFWGRSPGMWFGFASGVYLDLFSPRHMGLNTLLLTCIGFLIGSLASRLYREKYLSQILILVFVSLAESLLYFALSSGSLNDFVAFFLRYGLPGVLYTAIVGAAVFFTLHLSRVRWRVS
ncbi:MAG: rod shape-determining protein MreD [bacterium]